jgi:competence protein ComEA
MRSRRPSPEHQEAVSRRLALLSQELSSLAPEPPEGDPVLPLGGHTRVRAPRPAVVAPEAGPEAESPAVAPEVPAPGRHAARRARAPATLVPPPLRGRVALAPAHLAVVAVLVAAGLAVTAWWVARGEPRAVAAPVVSAVPGAGVPLATPVAVATPTATASEAGTQEEVTVDVAGKVRRPGIVVLPAGSRVVDALEAAGGARPGVDLTSLNLARLLVDGEQVLVGLPVPAGVVGSAVASAAPPAGGLVDLNTATAAELETLPEVGPVTAEAILAWRTEHGGFTAVEELLEVDGIGDATLATIAPHVTV